jgi:hypothetical protein
MQSSGSKANIEREFPGDQALQQVHLARHVLPAAAKRKRVTRGAYVRSLNLRPKNPARV